MDDDHETIARPGGSKFEVVRPRVGLYTDFFFGGERMD